ncbi:OLC1v1034183C1 [Oldenlandia corymbosa var. corymbosa]|uniref:OLC1v1034183C1 n=1 Tax=Oldenlandia corymbosa var. corymbosa TaxID=529605 RepID=A0AAV1CRN3_OLDCO|nr:OLC1v1034183C1 [Oldenlandia corymbosa var. corymbosa]
MTEVLQSPPHLPSASSSITYVSSPRINDGVHQHTHLNNDVTLINPPTVSPSPVAVYRGDTQIIQEEEEEEEEDYEEVGISGGGGGSSFVGLGGGRKKREREEGDQLSLLTVLVTVFRKSLVSCRSVEGGVEEQISSAMEISWPSNVRHVAHVTFDRFNGFLGLPVEFEPEVPRRPPSASTRVFGVSTESMQLSFDSRGNSVPTILLMMQRRLYAHGGLQAEGIFRINAENGQEEDVREQLNRGIVPADVDIHCLAGLIKAWFRELPTGLLDSLPPERVMQAQTEEECSQLVRELPSTEAALLDWAINLMADVAQMEHLNKMNARNVAMVFAPNMTQMADPLTALMYAVQVMNFLKTLIEKTLREREDSILDIIHHAPKLEPSDDNGHHGAPQPIAWDENEVNQEEQVSVADEPIVSSTDNPVQGRLTVSNETTDRVISSTTEITPVDEKENIVKYHLGEIPYYAGKLKDACNAHNNTAGKFQSKSRRTKSGQSSNSSIRKASKKFIEPPIIEVNGNGEKSKEVSIISRINSQTERVEAWR